MQNPDIVATIIALLEKTGSYRRVSPPVKIDNIEFPFDAVMVGPGDEENLVLIQDATGRQVPSIARLVRSFAILLNRMGSRRPITTVLVCSLVDFDALSMLEQDTRVIRVDGNSNLPDALRTLFPLPLPQGRGPQDSPIDVLRTELGKWATEPFIVSLCEQAKNGPEAVRTALYDEINDTISTVKTND